jgi:thiamine-monophosphate kinase
VTDAVALGPGGEFDLVRELLTVWGDRARGIGDDAAVLALPAGERLIVSTDTSVEGVHFRADWLTPEEIGWRATMAALSDLAAMGAAPRGVVVAVALPSAWRAALAAVARGVADAAAAAGTVIIGGDLSRADALVLGVTVLGSAARPLPRTGARPGDTLWVTGALGGPGAALAAWLAGAAPRPDDRARFAHPVARLATGQALAAAGAHAAIDLSDGLAADAAHLAAASGVALHVDLERVPCVAGVDPRAAAASGEEYELLVTAPPGLDVAAAAAATGVRATAVGAVAVGPAGAVIVQHDGRAVEPPAGHDHFSA